MIEHTITLQSGKKITLTTQELHELYGECKGLVLKEKPVSEDEKWKQLKDWIDKQPAPYREPKPYRFERPSPFWEIPRPYFSDGTELLPIYKVVTIT